MILVRYTPEYNDEKYHHSSRNVIISSEMLPDQGGNMSKKILTVDDSPSVRKMVEFSLKSKGYLMGSAGDGQEALDRMAEEHFDAIILDVNMPRMNGLEFLEKIKSDSAFASVPVIMLTTEGQDEDRDKAISLGATDYIVKPFKPSQLLTLLDAILS